MAARVAVTAPRGYDAPESELCRDYLGRRQTAATVYDVLAGAPPEWSARVGLFGAWGEGKTTVCRFVEQLAKADGHYALWFNPWAARNLDDLLSEFTSCLIGGLEEAGLNLQGTAMAKIVKRVRKATDPIQRLSEMNVFAKAGVGATLSAVNMLFRTDTEFINRIREQVPNKRIIVIIDDLDRVKPELIPTLMLSLREILDLPRFSFLLPFDPAVISAALVAEHPAWASGDRFLEKIIDFRYRLPVPTLEQCNNLLVSELREYCPYVPESATRQISDLLPLNPRRLKMLVRSLAMLKQEVLRHDENELNWTSIMFAALLRIESEVFLEIY